MHIHITLLFNVALLLSRLVLFALVLHLLTCVPLKEDPRDRGRCSHSSNGGGENEMTKKPRRGGRLRGPTSVLQAVCCLIQIIRAYVECYDHGLSIADKSTGAQQIRNSRLIPIGSRHFGPILHLTSESNRK